MFFILVYILLTQVINVLPSNVESVAEYISPTADIREKVIVFGPGHAWEHLLHIPLKGRVCSDSTVVINIGIENEYPNQHNHDLRVGLYDGTRANMFYILDKQDYSGYPPCYPITDNVDSTRVSGNVLNTFK